MTPSLLFGSLPRTMSTHLVRQIPAICPELRNLPGDRFTTRDSDPINHIGLHDAGLANRLFDQEAAYFPRYGGWVSQWSEGYAMKTATNPWVFEHLTQYHWDDLNFFVLRRDLADIGLNLLDRCFRDRSPSWLAVLRVTGERDLEAMARDLWQAPQHRCRWFPPLAEALVLADECLAGLVAGGLQEFRYEDLIYSAEDLRQWLRRDCGYEVTDADYTKESNFRAYRDEKLGIRNTEEWKRLSREVAAVRWGI